MTANLTALLVEEAIERLARDCDTSPAQLRHALRQLVADEEEVTHARPLSVADVARFVGREAQYIRREISRGRLRAEKHGGRFVIYEPDAIKWADAARVGPGESNDGPRAAVVTRPGAPVMGGLRQLLIEGERS